jgi:hypothetical protein
MHSDGPSPRAFTCRPDGVWRETKLLAGCEHRDRLPRFIDGKAPTKKLRRGHTTSAEIDGLRSRYTVFGGGDILIAACSPLPFSCR